MKKAMTALAFVLLYASGIVLGVVLCIVLGIAIFLMPAACAPGIGPVGEVHLMRL